MTINIHQSGEQTPNLEISQKISFWKQASLKASQLTMHLYKEDTVGGIFLCQHTFQNPFIYDM